MSEGAADVCAVWSDIVVTIEASGLEPGSELRVKDFDGIDQGFEIGDDGMPLDPILTYRRPDSGRATFDVSGTSGDGDAFEGELVTSGPTS